MVEPGSFLFVTWEGGGNVPAVLGVARRLAARGHDVTVLTEPCLRSAVDALGGRFVSFTRYFTREDPTTPLLDDYDARNPLAALDRTFAGVMFGPAEVVADETSRVIAARRPDVVVADYLMPGALVAAEASGVARAVLWHTPEFVPGPGRPAAGPGFKPLPGPVGRLRDRLLDSLLLRTIARHVAGYDAVRRRHGLPPVGDAQGLLGEYHRADLRLIQTTRAFDFPLDPAPPNVRYVGPLLDDPHWVADGAHPALHDDGRPLVVVGLSSTFQRQEATLRRAVEALGRLPVRGLATTGPGLARRGSGAGGAGPGLDLGPVPANVTVVESVSHAAVLPRAAAVVTHAGHGTVMRALAAGAPLVCLPMGRDQNDNAAKVAFHGAGLVLGKGASPAAIARAVSRVLDEPGFRQAAARLGERVRADAQEDAATSELETLAGTERTARNGAAA